MLLGRGATEGSGLSVMTNTCSTMGKLTEMLMLVYEH